MNASSRNKTRIDRVALCATFAAVALTVGVSTFAMSPATTPLGVAADLATIVADSVTPCPHAASDAQTGSL